MCSENFMQREFHTPLGTFTGKDIKTFCKTFSSIIKALIARGLYALYTLLVVWRVTEALQDPYYWILLFCITLIGLEALHTIIARKGGELKWVTPSVFFYLICAVPSIWLLELKLLSDRQEAQNSNSTASEEEETSSVINLKLSDEGWTLAMEQILIFVLVFGKWIAPKGELTRDQFSQLLLVNLGTGADIIELLETFNEDEVKVNTEIVYLVMSIWSWSLLQFCIVPTTYKELPEKEDPLDPVEDTRPDSSKTEETELEDLESADDIETPTCTKKNGMKPMLRSQSEGVAQAVSNDTNQNGNGMVATRSVGSSLYTKACTNGYRHNKVGFLVGNDDHIDGGVNGLSKDSYAMHTNPHGIDSVSKTETENQIVEEEVENETESLSQTTNNWDHSVIVVHDEEDDLKLNDNVSGWLSGRKCCVCFCCYTELWGTALSLMFQDVPFLITRLFIMFHYGVVSHMTVFFTFKNLVIILLQVNRIRVVVLEEHESWKEHMTDVLSVRKRNEEIRRERVRLKLRSETEEQPLETINRDDDLSSVRIDDVEIADNTRANPNRRRRWKLRKPKWRFWRI